MSGVEEPNVEGVKQWGEGEVVRAGQERGPNRQLKEGDVLSVWEVRGVEWCGDGGD